MGPCVGLGSRSPEIAIAWLGLVLGSCGRAPPPPGASVGVPAPLAAHGAYPVHVRDDRRATVTVRAEPQRIVTLLPSHTETVFALGVGGRVVGVDDYSRLPTEAARLPRLGGLYDVHFEALLAVRPDLVLLSRSNDTAARLEQSGLAVWAGEARTFNDVFRVIEAIGQMVGRGPEATRLSERIGADIASIETQLRGRDRVRVYFELDATPYTVGPKSFIGAMLTRAGGENIIPDGLGEFPKISPEAVIAGNPAIILGVSLEALRARPGWGTIAAVQAARVYELSPAERELVDSPGPRLADGVRALARRLHPEASL